MTKCCYNGVKLLVKQLLKKATAQSEPIDEQEYFENGILMVAMVKAGVELAYEAMTDSGIKAESAYYESLHEVPLIANLISRKKLYEMNKVISDTAEYGCYSSLCLCSIVERLHGEQNADVIGKGLDTATSVDNQELIAINASISITLSKKLVLNCVVRDSYEANPQLRNSF